MTTTALSQRQIALQDANYARLSRVEHRRRIAAKPAAAGRAAVADLIEHPPDWLESAQLCEVLCWPCRTAERTTEKLMGRLGLPYHRRGHPLTVGGEHGLVDRERQVLIAALRGRS